MVPRRPAIAVVCHYCHATVLMRPSRIAKAKLLFCKRACATAYSRSLQKACAICGAPIRSCNLFCSAICRRQFYCDPVRVAKRFWEYVDCTGGPEACWPWRAGVNKDGYGKFRVGSKMELAHVFTFALEHGPVPEGLHVLHACDNPPCCNDRHLWAGTQIDNMQDASQKKRIRFGEHHPHTHLTDPEVEEIIRLKGIAPQAIVARQFLVHDMTIHAIWHNWTWKHIPRN